MTNPTPTRPEPTTPQGKVKYIKANLAQWVSDEAFHTIAGACGDLIRIIESEHAMSPEPTTPPWADPLEWCIKVALANTPLPRERGDAFVLPLAYVVILTREVTKAVKQYLTREPPTSAAFPPGGSGTATTGAGGMELEPVSVPVPVRDAIIDEITAWCVEDGKVSDLANRVIALLARSQDGRRG